MRQHRDASAAHQSARCGRRRGFGADATALGLADDQLGGHNSADSTFVE